MVGLLRNSEKMAAGSAKAVTKKSMRTISIIAIVTTLSLWIQASLLLYASFSANDISLTASIIIFYALELVPVVMFMILFSPKSDKPKVSLNLTSTSTKTSTASQTRGIKAKKNGSIVQLETISKRPQGKEDTISVSGESSKSSSYSVGSSSGESSDAFNSRVDTSPKPRKDTDDSHSKISNDL